MPASPLFIIGAHAVHIRCVDSTGSTSIPAHSDLDDSPWEGSDWNQVGDDGESGDDEDN
jgi:hypothetical protein